MDLNRTKRLPVECLIHDDPTVEARLRIVESEWGAELLEIDSLLVGRVYETLDSEVGRRAVECILAKMGAGSDSKTSHCSMSKDKEG